MIIRKLIHKTICTNLLKIRIGKRYSQEHIASVLDIKQPSYHKMEGGLTRITGEQLGVLAEFYKVNICDFYKRNTDFNDINNHSLHESIRITEELENQRLLVVTLIRRNEDLERKAREKDLMIDYLLNEPKDNYEENG